MTEIISAGSFENGSIEDFKAGLDLLSSAKIESGFLLEKARQKYPLATDFGAKNDQEWDEFFHSGFFICKTFRSFESFICSDTYMDKTISPNFSDRFFCS